MDKLSIKLENGRIAVIHAFHLNYTYQGLIIGDPTPAINKMILNTVSYPKEWGVKTHLFRTDCMYTIPETLKPYIISAWLDIEPTTMLPSSYDGYSIVITWFAENIEKKSITQIVKEELNYFDWQHYAKGFPVYD